MRKRDCRLCTGKQLVVPLGNFSALGIPCLQMPKLHPKETRLNGVKSPVISFDVMKIFLRLPVVAQESAHLSDLFVVGCDSSGLPASSQILAWIEAEGS